MALLIFVASRSLQPITLSLTLPLNLNRMLAALYIRIREESARITIDEMEG